MPSGILLNGMLADVVDMTYSSTEVYNYARMYSILAAGAVVGYGVHRLIHKMGVPIFFVFAVAADARLHYAKLCIIDCLMRLGLWDHVSGSTIWTRLWQVLPAVILVLLAAWLWRDAKKLARMPSGEVGHA